MSYSMESVCSFLANLKKKYFLPPVTLSIVVVLCPVPTMLVAKHVYLPASLEAALKMVRDGVVVVLPLYLLVLVVEVIVVMVPLTFLCHCTLVTVREEDTVHTKVTD